MGLDSVELVMAVEEEFGLEITEGAAETMRTPRDVVNYVTAVLQTGNNTGCASQKGFYRLRRSVMEHVSLPRAACIPATQWSEILPHKNRKQLWSTIGATAEFVNWPALKLPRWLDTSVKIVVILTFAAPFSIIVIAPSVPLFFSAFLTGLMLAGILSLFLEWQLKSLRNRIPAQFQTLGDLVRRLTPPAHFKSGFGKQPWTREEIAKRIKRITIEQLGIEESSYSEGARFIEDLGMN